ncbi:unnamed protein product [Callosobruchus maculatus]|uniref:Uncharacterized protein n=1 Tax=Callosobruchus maculatus TaxID=64391 RepID=A0A653DPG2_CALMS|nr:unnamed protein product [Callosobruchus maculatus]
MGGIRNSQQALLWPPVPVECALPELSIKEPRYTKL